MKKEPWLIGILLAFLIGSLVPCYGQGNVIHGCFQKKEGQLRIVSGPGSSKPSEAAISWNILGPQGPEGPAGSTGPAGPTGPIGPAGKEIRVLDANDQYFGIFGVKSSPSSYWIDIFIPSLFKVFHMDVFTGNGIGVSSFFKGDNCTGEELYSVSPYDIAMATQVCVREVIGTDGQITYQSYNCGFKYITGTDSHSNEVVRSAFLYSSDVCVSYPYGIYNLWSFTEVILPFTTPVSLPVNLVY